MALRRSGPRVRKIIFDEAGHELEGLTVRAHGVTVREFIDTDLYVEQVELFIERLVEWDWQDDDGNPIPPTRAGIDGLDQGDVRTVIVEGWRQVSRAHAPLASRRGPDPAMESMIPMAPAGSMNGS